MTLDEMLTCSPFKLILGSYAAPKTPEAKEHLSNYLQLMHRALAGMNVQTFEKVCDQVIKTMARGQKPMPEDFINAQRALYESYRTNPIREDHKCSSCGSTGWVYVNMLSNEGEVKEHAKPCPLCRRGHPYQDAPTKRDWVETEHSPFKLEPTAKTVAFIKATFENDLDYSKSPKEILAQLTECFRNKTLKVRKSPMGKLFGNLKPSEPPREQIGAVATTPVDGSEVPFQNEV